MKYRWFGRVCGMLALLGCMAATASAKNAPRGPGFKAGFAERDITPEIGMEQPGGYGKAFHRTLHDPCKVRAAVFDDGRSAWPWWASTPCSSAARRSNRPAQAISEKCGIPPQAILISASHSHSSGPTGMSCPASTTMPRRW